MIIQWVLKGIPEISEADVQQIMEAGIVSEWWRHVGLLPATEVPERLNPRNLDWHQNHYTRPDPLRGGKPFHVETPFVSTTAGTVERDAIRQRNIRNPAWITALNFATKCGTADGWLFQCYVFVLGKPSVEHQGFAEELRDLNTYTAYSPFQPEGEITAKIIIPAVQISHAEFWEASKVQSALASGTVLTPSGSVCSRHYQPPERYHNIRTLLEG